jgi:hypothetical protein
MKWDPSTSRCTTRNRRTALFMSAMLFGMPPGRGSKPSNSGNGSGSEHPVPSPATSASFRLHVHVQFKATMDRETAQHHCMRVAACIRDSTAPSHACCCMHSGQHSIIACVLLHAFGTAPHHRMRVAACIRDSTAPSHACSCMHSGQHSIIACVSLGNNISVRACYLVNSFPVFHVIRNRQ